MYIFLTLGMEPWERIGSGVVELIAVFLLLTPRTVGYGAIVSHLTKLGIVVMDDGEELFVLAVVVFAGSFIVMFLRRVQIPVIGRWFQAEPETTPRVASSVVSQ